MLVLETMKVFLLQPGQTKWFSPMTDVDIDEALGLLDSIKWMLDLGYDNVDFELDSTNDVDSMINPKPNVSDFSAIFRVCHHLLAQSFRNFHVKFIRR